MQVGEEEVRKRNNADEDCDLNPRDDSSASTGDYCGRSGDVDLVESEAPAELKPEPVNEAVKLARLAAATTIGFQLMLQKKVGKGNTPQLDTIYIP